jgi:methylmalonyl-CoA mutase cobalamin-binding subunit
MIIRQNYDMVTSIKYVYVCSHALNTQQVTADAVSKIKKKNKRDILLTPGGVITSCKLPFMKPDYFLTFICELMKKISSSIHRFRI